MKPESIKAYKAIVILLLVIIGSPVVKRWFSRVTGNLKTARAGRTAAKEGV